MEKTLNIETLLSSKEFTAQVNQIANTFRVGYNDDIKNDVRQACSIAVWEALQLYKPEKVGGNFWGYAYPRMHEAAKREVANQRHLVHLPMNRINPAYGYETVTHTYEGLTFDDGHDKFGTVDSEAAVAMDIESALKMLDDETRYIFEVHSELREGRNGKCDFGSIAEELGIPAHVVRRRYIAAKEQLAAYLS